jgi:hypothetical protein
MFIPRLSHGQQGLVEVLVDRGVTTTIAPLYYMHHNRELSLLPMGNQMGTVLDPCTHIRQKPWAHRPVGFRALGFGNDPEPYDPDRAALSDDAWLDLALSPLNAARALGATILLSTFHVAGPVGSRGREIELMLAQLAVDFFRRERIDEPPPMAAVPVKREIYATIAVRLSDLMSPSARSALAAAYLAIDADGFWVKIEGFHERASAAGIRAGGAFLSALRAGGRPVVSCGPGQLHLGLLTDDLCASIGLAESERFVFPATWPEKKKDDKPKGRTRMAYHPKFHWSFRVGSQEATRAFAAAPCECEFHPASKPPDGFDVGRHAAALRADQANEALDGEREDRREWLLASSTKASWAADDAKVNDKFTSARRYEALFEGLDFGTEQVAPGEQGEF